MELTKRERDYLSALYLNPRWKIIRDSRGSYHLENELLNARPVRSLIRKGLIETIAEFKDTGYAHFVLSDAGRKAIEEVRQSAMNLPKRKRSRRLEEYDGRRGPLPKSWHKANDLKIIQMRMEGASVRMIAEKFNIREQTVRRILRPHGLIKRYRRLSMRREWGDI